MSFPTRKIGQDQVSAIGYGAMGISTGYGKVPGDEERLRFLDDVYASGSRFWDTSDVYGDSEELLGKWFKKTGKRNEIFLATKFGITFGDPSGRLMNGTPEYVKKALEQSLTKLGVDTVDLYYLHRADPQVPIEVTVKAMAELVSAGKVKYIGLSETSATTLRRAHAIHPIAAVQMEYSPFTLDIEDPKLNVLATARELGITVVAYSPLGRGLLTGQYKGPEDFEDDDFRRMVSRYSKENFPNILKIVDGLKNIGEKQGATPGQVALAWLLAQGPDVIPIPGTRKLKYLEENLGAVKVQLSKEEVERVRRLAEESDSVNGDRYPEGMMQFTFQDTPGLS